MAAPPRFKTFRAEDYRGAPTWFLAFLGVINDAFTSLANALTRGLTRTENLRAAEKVGFEFTTQAVVANTFPVPLKNDLGGLVKHLSASKLEAVTPRGAIVDPYSVTFLQDDKGLLQLTFQGLSGSTKYRCNIAYE